MEATQRPSLDDLFIKTRSQLSGNDRPSLDDLFVSANKSSIPKEEASVPSRFGLPKSVTDNPIYKGLDAYGQAGISNAEGFVEGATAGIPREIIKRTTGYEFPRGSTVGQIAGTVFGPGKVAGWATKGIKGFKGANIARLAAEGALVGATSPKKNAFDLEEAANGARGGALFGAGTGAVISGATKLAPAAKAGAVRIAQNILRPKGRFANKSAQIAETALEEGVLRSSAEGTRKAAQGKIDNLLDEVDQIAASVKNKTISAEGASKRMDALAEWYSKRGDPNAAAKVLEVKNNILSGEGLKRPIFGQVDQPLVQPENGFVIKSGSPSTLTTPSVQNVPLAAKNKSAILKAVKSGDVPSKPTLENADDVLIQQKGNKQVRMVAPKRTTSITQQEIRSPAIFGPSNRVSEKVGEEFKDLSIEKALKLRRDQDVLLRTKKVNGGFGSDTSSPEILARQEFTGAIRRDLGREVPEIGLKNRSASKLIDVANVAKGRDAVSSRNDLLGLADTAITTAAAFNPKALAILAAKKLYQGGKSGIARSAYGFSKNAERFGQGERDADIRRALIAF